MTQNRSGPAAMNRPGEDFEWVNRWAEASGLSAAREFAAEPVEATSVPAAALTAPVAAATRSRTYAIASDQLARDIADIEEARYAILAAEGAGVFILPAARRRKPSIRGVLRRRDALPVIIGAMLAFLVLIGYGAIASITALGQ